MIETEFEFTLPRGYVDKEGTLHREGEMRLATAADEIIPQRDPRVKANPAYRSIVQLSRVVTRLGSITNVTTGIIEGLFVSDFEYLQRLYALVNESFVDTVEVSCPRCGKRFEVDVHPEQRPDFELKYGERLGELPFFDDLRS
jgi:hypothetical protein